MHAQIVDYCSWPHFTVTQFLSFCVMKFKCKVRDSFFGSISKILLLISKMRMNSMKVSKYAIPEYFFEIRFLNNLTVFNRFYKNFGILKPNYL